MDVYEIVNDRIIAQMEQGLIPWQKPWTGSASGAVSRASGKAYSLLNQMLLGNPGEYVTFKQCTAEGGRIRKGAKSKIVVFWKILEKAKKDGSGQPVKNANGGFVVDGIPYLQYFNVFPLSDCEGLEPKWLKDDGTIANVNEPIDDANLLIREYIARSGVTLIEEKQNRACYSPSQDRVMMPLLEQFNSSEEYYSTAFHEFVHSTGHYSRLGRFADTSGMAMFGSESYSKEELVAEIGACALINGLGIETKSSFRNSVAYLQNWLSVLKRDKRFIISSAGLADKAIKLIRNETEQEVEVDAS